ncbi:MAG: NAD-dependent epimerase/dehydratase family protein [Granulosicoccus sp.]
MKILVTGSAGHLGEALVRSLRASGDQPVGVDIKESEFTDYVGNIADRKVVNSCIQGCECVIHTATLHKPHVGTHSRQDFVDTNISGTLNLLEASLDHDCKSFVYTSTTSTFGDAMMSTLGGPAVWVTEDLRPKPKNIYGVTKTTAEELCELFHRRAGFPCVVLKISRFFPEQDDSKNKRDLYEDANLKVNELLFRRVDIADVVVAHQLAIEKATEIGFDRFIISCSTPFNKADAEQLGINAPAVLERYVPSYLDIYAAKNWKMFPTISRVYDSSRARDRLGWKPEYTFAKSIEMLYQGSDYRSELTHQIGAKRYHDTEFDEGPYPVSSF